MTFDEFKPGMIIKVLAVWALHENAVGSGDIIAKINNENVIVLANPTKEFAYNSLKVLYGSRVGYLSWNSTTLPCEIIK